MYVMFQCWQRILAKYLDCQFYGVLISFRLFPLVDKCCLSRASSRLLRYCYHYSTTLTENNNFASTNDEPACGGMRYHAAQAEIHSLGYPVEKDTGFSLRRYIYEIRLSLY